MKKTFSCSLATLGVVGRFYGSGTLATALTLPLVYGLSFLPEIGYWVVIIIVSGIALNVSEKAVHYYQKQDPPEVVIDEVLGCLITFVGIPLSWPSFILGFVLFRFLDISKWFGIRKLGNVRGAWGILLDDVAAGVLSNLVLRLIFVWSDLL